MEGLIQKMFTFFYCVLSFPYNLHWEAGLRTKFFLKPKTFHFYLWYFSFVLSANYFVVLLGFLYALVPLYLRDSHYDKLSFHCLWSTLAFNFLNQQLPHILMGQDVMQLGNGMTDFVKNMEHDHFGSGSFAQSQRIRTKILYYLCLQCLGSSLTLMVGISYHFRQDYWQMGSYVYRLVLLITQGSMKDTSNDLLASGFALVVDMWVIFWSWGGWMISFHLNLCFMNTFKTTIAQMMRMTKEENGSRLIFKQMLIYSKLRILTTLFNQVYGKLYIPIIKSFMCMMISAAVLITVRLAPKSDPLVGMFGFTILTCCPIVLALFISFMAMPNEYSEKFCKYLKKGGMLHGAVGRRLVRAYKVEAVLSGDFYKITRVTCLTVLGLLSNLSGSMLISIKI